MKNYVQVWFINILDDMGNQYASQFVNSNEEVGPWIATNMPAGGSSSQAMYYFKLNKFNVTFLLNAALYASGIGSMPFTNTTFFVTETDDAQDWDSQSDDWGYDGSDPKSVKAQKSAGAEIAAHKSAQSGHFTVDFAVYLALLASTYIFERQFLAALRVQNLLKEYQEGKITEAAVVADIAKLPAI